MSDFNTGPYSEITKAQSSILLFDPRVLSIIIIPIIVFNLRELIERVGPESPGPRD